MAGIEVRGRVASSLERETRILPPRKQKVLALMAKGLTNSAIAHQLSIDPKTVEVRISGIYLENGSGDPKKDKRAEAVLQHIETHPDFDNPLGCHQVSQLLFSKREKEVLALVGKGLSNQEISQKLFVAARTIERHISGILSKLEIDRAKQNPRIMMILAAKAIQDNQKL